LVGWCGVISQSKLEVQTAFPANSRESSLPTGTPNPKGNCHNIVRATTRRVNHDRDAAMTMRWVAAGFLDAQKSFPKSPGINDLWMLKAALH